MKKIVYARKMGPWNKEITRPEQEKPAVTTGREHLRDVDIPDCIKQWANQKRKGVR